MKKIIIMPVLFLALLFGGCAGGKPAASVSESSASPANKSRPSRPAFIPISESQDGVEATIENIAKENGKTVVELALSNHVYDLSAMDVKNGSSFSGIKPSEYNIISSAAGGHHVQAEMIFEKEIFGSLTIGLNDSLVFNFNIP
ncbi:MAG: hypothetical protein A3J65_00510 [Candidatus Buchananbacteria bacterium RIFCSPHIGHO2_02_FULL_45_11b]|uniref:Uncharacterized protein n=4 Tax=Candidatus Buchananiibacteriota TaxID=1817903 RepID=A0A1G1Y4U1_9BACT|nr:MAG: hypothetical protein A2663_01095 [Candidatus Buchananbacteria bacterium RIFCSPHIGHO2_01_FULL_46_12]OGY49811.1 MAG: hypothetical protein A3J65_00510 [Candidatus Buchananbacteria bacterium RIFCSPHIGHO2_02_FULL_45_11b]OGY53602.1 MAG: hypothetical protein A3B15_03450 [Candidatus Buchananbacteria bacterium RIFCSPLOWO2_01_FULL_45_31]OGY57357.1 MAG: hypothetical protein A3H67_04430 [Candidatus Buchananbacteria bacterium RIFCSPLOWO2_02_FULL_46_11b]